MGILQTLPRFWCCHLRHGLWLRIPADLMHKDAIRIVRTQSITVMARVALLSEVRIQARSSRGRWSHCKAERIKTAPRHAPPALPLCIEVRRDTDHTSTEMVTELAASPIVDDDDDRKIRIEASVLTALMAFAAMVHLLLWFRS
jgi:hypothetical protein